MKHRYEFIVGHRIIQVVTLSGDHDEDANRVIAWALREASFIARGEYVEVRHVLWS